MQTQLTVKKHTWYNAIVLGGFECNYTMEVRMHPMVTSCIAGVVLMQALLFFIAYVQQEVKAGAL